MKTKKLACALIGFALVATLGAAPADASDELSQELFALVTRVQLKLRAGEKSSTQLAPEVAALDALREKAARQPELAAKVTRMEYSLCNDVLKETAKAAELRALLTSKYLAYIQGTPLAQEFAMAKRMEETQAAQAGLVGKPAPELTFSWSSQAGLTKLSELKGKVVVLDFWATWCGPCIATFPQIRELVEHYKDREVAVIGVTSLQGYVMGLEPARIDTRGNPQKEYELMPAFIKAKNMTWSVAFAEQPVFNPAYGVMGIPHMAIIGPDGVVRHNGLHPGMPRAEKLALIDALLPASPASKSGE